MIRPSLVATCFTAFLLFACTLRAENAELIEANQQKLNSIVLPDLNFQNVPVSVAISKIRTLANARLDPVRGVNFAFQSAGLDSTTITLVMTSPTLGQALDEIAQQEHLLILPQEFCIAIVPKPAPSSSPPQ